MTGSVLRKLGAALALVAVTAGSALAWTQPARGTPERRALLDLVRIPTEEALGPGIEFEVLALRVEGDRAFAQLYARRPGGAEIDIADTPLVRLGERDLDMFDGPRVEALLLRIGDAWTIQEYVIGATDAWFTSPPICREWGAVLVPGYCPG